MKICQIRFSDYIFCLFLSLCLTSSALSEVCNQKATAAPPKLHVNLQVKLPVKPPVSSQTNYSGIITLKNTEYILQIKKSEKKYKLAFANLQIERVVKRLNTGDFVSIQTDGIITNESTEPTLKIISLNYIGLNVLLGTWIGSEGVCYHFKNFTTFYIFNPNSKNQCPLPNFDTPSNAFREMNYFVNPDDLQWILLISDKKSQYAAELFINSTINLQLNLFDQATGNTISKVILRR